MYIVDAMAHAYRLHSGFGTQALTDSEGRPTSVLHGFMRLLFGLLKHTPPPTHMAVVVDAPGTTFRHDLFPEYKANRPPTPPELITSVARLLLLVTDMGIPVLSVPGVEADDVIGSLAVRCAGEHGMDVTIVSPDKDFMQLLRPGIKLMRMVKTAKPAESANSKFYTCDDFIEEHELPDPALWADVLALMGDASDNVPGVKGVGVKSAHQLVKQMGDVEAVLNGASQVKRKGQREMLQSEEGAAAARLSKELVTVRTDLKHPPVRDTPIDSFALRVPGDGGQLAVSHLQRFELEQNVAELSRIYTSWAKHGGSPA